MFARVYGHRGLLLAFPQIILFDLYPGQFKTKNAKKDKSRKPTLSQPVPNYAQDS